MSKLSSVKAVYPVRIVPRPESINAAAVDGAPQNSTSTLSIHQMTGVDKLHKMGIRSFCRQQPWGRDSG